VETIIGMRISRNMNRDLKLPKKHGKFECVELFVGRKRNI
jgi:hypothetical protein